jgi:hypothetical protein
MINFPSILQTRIESIGVGGGGTSSSSSSSSSPGDLNGTKEEEDDDDDSADPIEIYVDTLDDPNNPTMQPKFAEWPESKADEEAR